MVGLFIASAGASGTTTEAGCWANRLLHSFRAVGRILTHRENWTGQDQASRSRQASQGTGLNGS